MNTLYEIKIRQSGFSHILKVITKRAEIVTEGVEKVIPPILEYNEDGSFKTLLLQDVLNGITKHPYKPNSPQFNAERLADLEVSALYKHLEHFPSLPRDPEGIAHPVAEFIYSYMVYLKPAPELATILDTLDFQAKGELLAQIFERLQGKYAEEYPNLHLDFHSVPKKNIGTFCYIARSKSKVGIVPKLFGFKMENAIPTDRIAREISSLKSAEKFINPVPVEGIPENLQPYISKVKVAIIGTAITALDSADIYPSARKKLACKLSREKIVVDPSTVDSKTRNLKFVAYKSGVNVVHSEIQTIDEEVTEPGAIRLVFPGGVKVAGQFYWDSQMYSMEDNSEIDVALDFRTFAAKGAVASFALMNGKTGMTREEAIDFFNSLKKTKLYLDGVEYEGYVGELPVMRPGQRYSDLCKATNISFDMIAHAITKKRIEVNPHYESEYALLKNLRAVIKKQL